MCCKSRGALSRLGLLWGISALAALLVAFISGSWLYTKEPITLPNSQVSTFISFRIGLWRVCPYVMRTNSTAQVPPLACSFVKYSGWEEVGNSELGLWTTLDLAQVFITRMRACTILCGSAIILLLLSVIFALLGYCNSDNKTIIACGCSILGGLSLGTGLVVFASSLSETLMEISQYHKESVSAPLYDYRYGWCFFAAGLAFILTNMATVFSLSGYLTSFPSVDDMVKQMVPGAERKLREHQQLSSEFLVRHTGPAANQYNPLVIERPKFEAECGPLLNKTPPDVCTTSKCQDFNNKDLASMAESNSGIAHTLAGQTIPITIKNYNSTAPLSFCNLPINKYGTIHQTGMASHQGFLSISELESPTSTSSYCGKSKTLQHQRNRKKCMQIETFQVPESDLTDFNNKRTNEFSYSGSAV